MDEIGKYAEAYYQFSQIPEYKNSEQMAIDILENQTAIFYNEAVENYERMTNTSIKKALNLFELIPDYEDSAEYIEKIHFMNSMCGTYVKTGYLDTDATYVIDYGKITRYEGNSKRTSSMYIVKLGDTIYYKTYEPIPLIQTFKYVSGLGSAYWRYSDSGFQTDFERMQLLSSSTETIKKPEIDMTADDVKKSTWGNPLKVNKTTYSWGTTEQWIYEDHRYIYFRNGRVTAIQE